MPASNPALKKTLVDLETRFWQSMVDDDTDAALSMLNEPAVMVSSHGAMQFDHEGYRKMAEQGTMRVTAFELDDFDLAAPNDATAILTYTVKQSVAERGRPGAATTTDMLDSSTWLRTADGWRCVMHTETPLAAKDARAAN
ncbi:nuclear transport factor 2 family protein [Variovorax sp. J22P168]|uniref:nuclear transport factor 2 family protein n=1 Tax=Variovorax jilinensis TaxID=3053513 RepID=UPI002576C747|nr:nuclear transport factor 2 family protein [Variovorax sp. J22P168]MDM0013571.1 nuclear transport factor 2 family protein [Variovorax sp. J22P168]